MARVVLVTGGGKGIGVGISAAFLAQGDHVIVCGRSEPETLPEIHGQRASFIPANLKTELLDGVIQVEPEPSREMARRCAREEGMLVGISSGATLAAIAQKLPELPAGDRILGFNYDTGERYLSIEGFLPSE